MPKLLGIAALAAGSVLVTGVGHAQWPEATVRHMFAWEYRTSEVTGADVVYETRIDGGAPLRVEILTLSGQSGSYFMRVPTMPVGQHVLEVRACNVSGCSGWSSPLVFSFSHRLEMFQQGFDQ